ncbi:uncharacterized protein CCOS01_07265 [Colletotrichum costaricense]|uniref:Uncharacterized protein n=1 Tax=Colletotrichum costaricense TaxID=1209916 RepID=A0AAI9YWK0_9PEZI|nr:uncharacterized protein CCOS01_07265 [Colletotrichum costaricense]KAK1527003.1 hypothetical protein CCOS01_07265 [Colletotrichum costaricense]
MNRGRPAGAASVNHITGAKAPEGKSTCDLLWELVGRSHERHELQPPQRLIVSAAFRMSSYFFLSSFPPVVACFVAPACLSWFISLRPEPAAVAIRSTIGSRRAA